jgi:hypothetical protein
MTVVCCAAYVWTKINDKLLSLPAVRCGEKTGGKSSHDGQTPSIEAYVLAKHDVVRMETEE